MPRDRTKFTKERPPDPNAPDSLWRLFVGIEIPEAQQAHLKGLLKIASASETPIRWIHANAAHLTLQFIGEVEIATAEILRMSFPTALPGFSPFTLAGDGAGAFPSLNKPQIIWLGLKGDVAELRRIHRATETYLLNMSIETEQRQFQPHITLGRSRDTLQTPDINAIHALMKSNPVKAQLKALEAPFVVDQITLFRSHLTGEGATYERLAVARLT